MTDPLPNNTHAPQHEASPTHELVLVKGEQRYLFRCGHGEEADLLVALADLVRDPDTDFNWFDAAVLAHVIGRRLGRDRDRLKER